MANIGHTISKLFTPHPAEKNNASNMSHQTQEAREQIRLALQNSSPSMSRATKLNLLKTYKALGTTENSQALLASRRHKASRSNSEKAPEGAVHAFFAKTRESFTKPQISDQEKIISYKQKIKNLEKERGNLYLELNKISSNIVDMTPQKYSRRGANIGQEISKIDAKINKLTDKIEILEEYHDIVKKSEHDKSEKINKHTEPRSFTGGLSSLSAGIKELFNQQKPQSLQERYENLEEKYQNLRSEFAEATRSLEEASSKSERDTASKRIDDNLKDRKKTEKEKIKLLKNNKQTPLHSKRDVNSHNHFLEKYNKIPSSQGETNALMTTPSSSSISTSSSTPSSPFGSTLNSDETRTSTSSDSVSRPIPTQNHRTERRRKPPAPPPPSREIVMAQIQEALDQLSHMNDAPEIRQEKLKLSQYINALVKHVEKEDRMEAIEKALSNLNQLRSTPGTTKEEIRQQSELVRKLIDQAEQN